MKTYYKILTVLSVVILTGLLMYGSIYTLVYSVEWRTEWPVILMIGLCHAAWEARNSVLVASPTPTQPPDPNSD